MQLELSQTDREFRDRMREAFRTVVSREIRDTVLEGRHLTRDQIVEAQQALNAEGLAVPRWPTEWGGQDRTDLQRHLWHEEMPRAGVPIPLAFNASMIGPVLAQFGSDGISMLLIDMTTPGVEVRPIELIDGGHEVNEVWFFHVRVPGDLLVGEPGGGWTARAAGVRASFSDGASTLDGVADPVVGGEHADVLVVTAALTEGATGGFVVSVDDVERTGYAAADLTRAASVRFDGSAATPLGEPGRGLTASIATISDLTRIMGANQALGVMQSQLRATTDYLRSRKQFGVTLHTFQSLTFRPADMYVELELAHSMVDWATMTIAGGDRDVVADAADRVGLQVARSGRYIGREAIQLHGGIGMTAEYAVGVGTAHLEVLDQWLGNAHHYLCRLAERVTDHGLVEAL